MQWNSSIYIYIIFIITYWLISILFIFLLQGDPGQYGTPGSRGLPGFPGAPGDEGEKGEPSSATIEIKGDKVKQQMKITSTFNS